MLTTKEHIMNITVSSLRCPKCGITETVDGYSDVLKDGLRTNQVYGYIIKVILFLIKDGSEWLTRDENPSCTLYSIILF